MRSRPVAMAGRRSNDSAMCASFIHLVIPAGLVSELVGEAFVRTRSRGFSMSIAAPFFVALCAGCAAESPDRDATNIVGAGGMAGGSAGMSGGASGPVAAAGGSAGTSSTLTAGSSGNAGSGGASGTGTGGQAGSAGTSGNAGSAAARRGRSSGRRRQRRHGRCSRRDQPAREAARSGRRVAKSPRSPTRCVSQYQNMNDAYYQKYASANGVIVATGTGVDDEAIVRYCRLLTEMVSNEEVREAIIADKMWFTMIAEDEQLSSLPQIDQDLRHVAQPARARSGWSDADHLRGRQHHVHAGRPLGRRLHLPARDRTYVVQLGHREGPRAVEPAHRDHRRAPGRLEGWRTRTYGRTATNRE